MESLQCGDRFSPEEELKSGRAALRSTGLPGGFLVEFCSSIAAIDLPLMQLLLQRVFNLKNNVQLGQHTI